MYIAGGKMKLKQTAVPQGTEKAALGFFSHSDVNNTGSVMGEQKTAETVTLGRMGADTL